MSHLEFLLVPDSGAARRLRRVLAEQGACGGVVVGTWRELLELAAQAYLPRRPDSDWAAALERALQSCEGAFWTQSLTVAPRESAAAVETVFVDLAMATGLMNLPELPAGALLPARAAARYADLRRLEAELSGALPDELATLRRVLGADAAHAVRLIRVARVDGFPPFAPAERALIAKLNADAGVAVENHDRAELLRLAAAHPGAPHATALGALQTHLFTQVEQRVAVDDSLQWIGCRDPLEEAEIAAGIVQQRLAADPTLRAADFTLLMPDDYVYGLAVADTFMRAGLALSGLPVERWRRDLGRDVVLQFLHCRNKPAPVMAIAACLTSPLMPWTHAQGMRLAQRVMEGDYALEPPHDLPGAGREMLGLLRAGDDASATLAVALQRFSCCLQAAPGFEAHLVNAHAAIGLLVDELASARSLDWRELRRRVAPRHLAADRSPEFNREGVTVWREGLEPWRAARHLLVLGFTAGHYPSPVGNSPVFTDDELMALAGVLDLPLPTRGARLHERRARFRRQLAAVAESVTFLVPRRGVDGQAARLPDSHVFIADVLGQQDNAEILVKDVDDAAQRANLRHLALAPAASAEMPRLPALHDLELECDLLGLRRDAQGEPRPESPSSLETLMVSPLGWLLRRLGVEPVVWVPEEPDVLLLGQLAHAVFEDLFRPGEPLPQPATIERRVASLLDARIGERAPFLRAAQWQVECSDLAGSLARAALGWHDKLAALGAEILGGELWLAGRFHGIAVHGQADLVVGLPDGSLLVVDYKRSSSKARRERMERGFDSQARLYRQMLETGGAKAGDAQFAERLRRASRIGLVYYLLNDQVALCDSVLDGTASIPRWDVINADISARAIALIERRLDEVRAGHIRLNGCADETWFQKNAGVPPYALDVSPLIRLHLCDGLSEGLA